MFVREHMNNTKRKQCIGTELRKLRRSRDKTLEQVANAVGLKKTTIGAYEKGRISIPIDNLDDICTFLGVDYIDFLKQVQNKLNEEK